MLALLSLEERADVRMLALSGGETRRVDLACTLMGGPELVILDEPTTGLDPESRREVWRLVSDLRDGGATVLITTHYLEEAETLADRLEIMHAGRIVRSGTPTEIAAGHPSTISFAERPRRARRPRRHPPRRPRARAHDPGDRRAPDARCPTCWPGPRTTRSRSTISTLAARASRPCSSRSPTAATRPTALTQPRPAQKEPSDDTPSPTLLAAAPRSLTRWNAVLLSRNRLAFFYAVVLPLLPLALLFTGERGDGSVGRGRRSSPCSSSSRCSPSTTTCSPSS